MTMTKIGVGIGTAMTLSRVAQASCLLSLVVPGIGIALIPTRMQAGSLR